jgi:xylan 1,4-beta-xylosidase
MTATAAASGSATSADAPAPLSPAAPSYNHTTVTVDARSSAPALPLSHFWKTSVGSGHAALGLRTDWQEQLAAVHRDLGIQGVRFHGSFDDDMGPVVVAANATTTTTTAAAAAADATTAITTTATSVAGPPSSSRLGDGVAAPPTPTVQYNFTLLDTLYDAILSAGVSPIVELSFMPYALADCAPFSACRTFFAYKAITEPPNDYGQWRDLVTAFAQHLVDRHGLDTVAQWRFECWNELWGMPWGDGSVGNSTYMALYNASYHGVKSVSPRLQVGVACRKRAVLTVAWW